MDYTNDLGLLKDYGNFIISFWLIVYGILFSYLEKYLFEE